ncbi:hypothetical protein IGI04_040430 [Brassica rapa subsp. trilocularis]|uniref:Uncharacterized protein n=1 Tax=Brassica rapa subsp. trilocularis TaxID=1813537 RepID=A0ABQ7KMV0_BRACM|nr:hypothetical protein IGI04_040430 [Brassica rapa subsp. trilocularis]
MKEKPSHHPKREIRAQQTHFGRTEERSIKYQSDPRTVNFISVLPLIQKEPGNGRDIIGKISIPGFQIIYPIVKSTYGNKIFQSGNLSVSINSLIYHLLQADRYSELFSESYACFRERCWCSFRLRPALT